MLTFACSKTGPRENAFQLKFWPTVAGLVKSNIHEVYFFTNTAGDLLCKDKQLFGQVLTEWVENHSRGVLNLSTV